MKKLNKKGFTLIELVIVIAVIAILAAVLIPTFTNIIEKANESNAVTTASSLYQECLALDLADGKQDGYEGEKKDGNTTNKIDQTKFAGETTGLDCLYYKIDETTKSVTFVIYSKDYFAIRNTDGTFVAKKGTKAGDAYTVDFGTAGGKWKYTPAKSSEPSSPAKIEADPAE